MVRDVPRQRDMKKRYCLSRVLLHCGYFEKAGNSLPLSEVADSPMLANMGCETVYWPGKSPKDFAESANPSGREEKQCDFIVVSQKPLNHCGPVTPYGDINLGQHWHSGNGLLPDGTKPLPEPMLTFHQRYGVLWHSSDSNFTRSVHEPTLCHVFRDDSRANSRFAPSQWDGVTL